MSHRGDTRTKVLVLGGYGFLASHIIRLLQTQRPNDYAIRAMDIRPFTSSCFAVDVGSACPVEAINGDICDYDMLLEAMDGVDIVVHSAAIVDYWRHTREEVHRVNYLGTENVIKACKAKNVKHLIYTSTLSVNIPHTGIEDGSEESPHCTTSNFLYGWYAETKSMAELAVLGANGTPTNDGEPLLTCAIRPLAMYGENDPWILPGVIQSAILGHVFKLGTGASKCHSVYVGNVAWCHVLACDAFRAGGKRADQIAGHCYIPTDETPIASLFEQIQPMMDASRLKYAPVVIPYWFVYMLACMVEMVAWVVSPVWVMPKDINRVSLAVLVTNFWYTTDKATKHLEYQPLYSGAEAMRRTCEELAAYPEKYKRQRKCWKFSAPKVKRQ